MKNFIKLIFVFVFLVAIGFFWSFQTEASKASATNFYFDESPRTLFLNNCARCHGADGKSQTELGRLNDSPDISSGRARKKSAAKLTQLITKGKGSMPGFGKKLTREQISGLANHVRGL